MQQNDHDLLIELKTEVRSLVREFREFKEKGHAPCTETIKNSEKIKALEDSKRFMLKSLIALSTGLIGTAGWQVFVNFLQNT